jgi:hypothetical protein
MKRILIFFAALYAFGVAGQTSVQQVTEKARLVKSEMRTKMVGESLKYDGSKITYYEVKESEILKEFEVTLFLRDNYTLYFNGNASSVNHKVSMKIYDQPYDYPNRKALFSKDNISGTELKVSTIDLNKKYQELNKTSEKLKSIFVEYTVPGGSQDLGGIVLIFGY